MTQGDSKIAVMIAHPKSLHLLASILLIAPTGLSCADKNLTEPSTDSDFQRIVVIGPSSAATIDALNQNHRVVGVSDYCTVEALADTEKVGGLHDASLEKIAALVPDLIIVQGSSPRILNWCELNNVEFQEFRTDSLEDWYHELQVLGKLLDVEEQALSVINKSRKRLMHLSLNGVNTDDSKTKILLVVGRRQHEASGIVVAGADSFLSELLFIAGAENALGDSSIDYFDLNEEAILLLDPDAIFDFLPPDTDGLRVWKKAFPNLRAVKNSNIFSIEEAWTVQPGPSMPRTAEFLANLVQQIN